MTCELTKSCLREGSNKLVEQILRDGVIDTMPESRISCVYQEQKNENWLVDLSICLFLCLPTTNLPINNMIINYFAARLSDLKLPSSSD